MTHAVARAHFLSPPEVPEGIFAQDAREQGARTSRAWPNVSARPEEQLPPQGEPSGPVFEAPGIHPPEPRIPTPPNYIQPVNLKEFRRVCQLKLPLLGMYSLAYQKVQSSLGSMDMLV